MTTWLPDDTDLLFEYHLNTDAATSTLNHATGTTDGVINGAPTYGAGFMDISGVGPKGLDTGYIPSADDLTFIALVDPNNGVGICSASGLNDPLTGLVRYLMDANPTNGQKHTINGVDIEFVTSGATGYQVNIGATVQETAFAFGEMVNANTGVFGCTAFCPIGNSVVFLETTITGLAANAITATTTATNTRVRAAGNPTTPVTTFSAGLAGESLTTGLVASSTAFVYRNANIGAGGLASVTFPGTNYYVVFGWGGLRDFPHLQVCSGGALSTISVGTTSGRKRQVSGTVQVALSGAGTGSAKVGFVACLGRVMTDAERLAAYLAIKAEGEALGLTVN